MPCHAGSVGTRDPDADRAALVALLEASRAPWKIVVGHHPPRSYGEHCFWSNNGECKHMRWIKRVLKDHKVGGWLGWRGVGGNTLQVALGLGVCAC